MEFFIFLGLVVAGYLIYVWIKDSAEQKELVRSINNWEKEKQLETVVAKKYLLDRDEQRKRLLSTHNLSNEKITRSITIGDWEWSVETHKEGVDDTEEFSWNTYKFEVLLIKDDGFAVIKYPHFHPSVDAETQSDNIDDIDKLEYRITEFNIDDIVDVKYSKDTINISGGESRLRGTLNAETYSQSFSVLGNDAAASFGRSRTAGTIELSGSQGAVSFDFPLEASLRIYTRRDSEPFNITVDAGVGLDDEDMLRNLFDPELAGDWLKDEVFDHVKKLEVLIEALQAHLSLAAR